MEFIKNQQYFFLCYNDYDRKKLLDILQQRADIDIAYIRSKLPLNLTYIRFLGNIFKGYSLMSFDKSFGAFYTKDSIVLEEKDWSLMNDILPEELFTL